MLLNRGQSALALEIIECFIDIQNRKQGLQMMGLKEPRFRYPQVRYHFRISVLASVTIFYVTLWTLYWKLKEQYSIESGLDVKETKPKDPETKKILLPENHSKQKIIRKSTINRERFVTPQNKTFDLTTKEGKQKWVEDVEQKMNQKPLNSKPIIIKPTFSRIVMGREQTQSSYFKIPSPLPDLDKEPKRARTDINIHDPSKPVPSVLNYPTVDKNGKLLRRIFIPGRGWVSARTLELEREQLMFAAQLVANKELTY